MKSQQRQGDLFFEEVEKMPDQKEIKSDGVLANGEVTGHKHQVISPDLSEVDMFLDSSGDIFMKSSKTIVVGHEEHNQIELPPGKMYRVSRQREYDPISADRERKVLD